MKALAQAFVVREYECLILLDRASARGAKLVPLKSRRSTWICGSLGLTSKKLRASRSLLRRNSYTEPWNWFVPEVVTMET